MADDEQRHLPHFYFPGAGQRENFTSPRSGGGSGRVPVRDRAEHAALNRLMDSLQSLAVTEARGVSDEQGTVHLEHGKAEEPAAEIGSLLSLVVLLGPWSA